MLNQHSQAALQERVKELTCLYGMSQIAKQIDISLEDLLYRIMELIPPAIMKRRDAEEEKINSGIN